MPMQGQAAGNSVSTGTTGQGVTGISVVNDRESSASGVVSEGVLGSIS